MMTEIGGYEISSLGDADPITRVKDSSGEEDRFRENRMSLGRLSFRGPRDLLPQNSLRTYKVKTLDFGKCEKKLSRKGTTQEEKTKQTNKKTTRNEHPLSLKGQEVPIFLRPKRI